MNTRTSDISSFEIGFDQISPFQISPFEVGFDQSGTKQESILEISPFKISPTQIDLRNMSLSQINSFKNSLSEKAVIEISSTQVGVGEISIDKFAASQVDVSQIHIPQIDSSEISFTSSISSEQLFSSYHTTSQIINELNNSATNIWSELLQSETELEIDFQITDLPAGQLAEATITGFDSSGKTNSGRILIDHDANGVCCFTDETPLDNSEFINQNSASYFIADPESEAHGKYDLLITVSGLKPQRKQ